MAEWSNWAETVKYDRLEQKYKPETLEELKACVKEAARQNWRLRAVGPGHSWSNLGVPSYARGAVICMTEMHPFSNVVERTGSGAIVEIGGGLTIKKMNEWLDSQGLAVFNMGDANPQLVVGGISTETHGSGVKHAGDSDSDGSFSEYVEGMSLVRADGESYTLTQDELPAGRVSLGKLGVIHSVRLRVRERYFLEHDQRLVKFTEETEKKDVEDLLADKSVRHFEFWHYPHTDQAERIVRKITSSTEIKNPLRLDQEFFIKLMSGGFAKMGELHPDRIPALLNNSVTNFKKTFEVIGRQGPWHEILVGKSNVWRKAVKTWTMEYQLPYRNLWPAFNEYLESIEKVKKDKGVYAAPPTQIRFSQRSEKSLLTNLLYEPTVSFSVSFFRTHRGVHTWFPDLERRFIKYGGRPHWGKMYYQVPQNDPNDQSPEEVQRRNNWSKFEEIRRRFDPNGVFAFAQAPYVPDPEAFQDY